MSPGGGHLVGTDEGDKVPDYARANSSILEQRSLLGSRIHLFNTMRRQPMCFICTALGYPENASRHVTFQVVCSMGAPATNSLADSRKQIQYLLNPMNPGPERSIIHIGNDAAHHYSCADAREAVDDHEQPLHRMIDLLREHSGSGGDMQQAARRLEACWEREHPALHGLSDWHQLRAIRMLPAVVAGSWPRRCRGQAGRGARGAAGLGAHRSGDLGEIPGGRFICGRAWLRWPSPA